MLTVAKFGGTSLANASQIRKVLAIVARDPSRQVVVVSAPGKRDTNDQKITDLFYEWHRRNEFALATGDIQKAITDRYLEIITELEISFDLTSEIHTIATTIADGASAAYSASRGEYLCAKIVARALGYDFVDAASCIFFDEKKNHRRNDAALVTALQGKKAVVPGFYGSLPNGEVHTFSRGGSDVTGALVARALHADRYENWTDVSGMLMADPRVVDTPRRINTITYRELRELAYMGANVFHEEAMFPVEEAKIPTRILNTNNPDEPGTQITANAERDENNTPIVGIAGRKNFTVITVEKSLMNQEIGFARRLLKALEDNAISFEHMPSGIDTLSVIIDDRQLDHKLEKVVSEIQTACTPDTLETHPNMAMVAVVGRAMVHTQGVAAKVFTAIAQAGVNIRMINQGSSEISIIIGVENEDYENTIRAIYKAFI